MVGISRKYEVLYWLLIVTSSRRKVQKDDIAQVHIWMWMNFLRQGVNLGATEGRSSEALTDRGQRPCRARQRAPSSPQIIIETSFCQCSTKYSTL